MTQHPLESWLRLVLTAGVGAATQRKLLAALGLPEHIFAASHATLARVSNNKIASALLAAPDQKRIDAALDWLAASNDNHIVTLADDNYPKALLQISDPPSLLYVKGDASLLNTVALAIVGARTPTPQGELNAEAFAHALAQAGWTIVSGMALGIDAAAHRGALQAANGRTIAFIGTGIDRVYPASHHALAHQIAESGAIVSEFALTTPPRKSHFPHRNRLIAGLSQGVLVVEAAPKSGSLITARLAMESNRDVFAIPGSIHSQLSRGCHQLIRDGAKLVELAADIIEELPAITTPPPPPAPAAADKAVSSPPDQPQPPTTAVSAEAAQAQQVFDKMGFDPVDADSLAELCGLTPEALQVILLLLELDGRVARLDGGRLQRLQGQNPAG